MVSNEFQIMSRLPLPAFKPRPPRKRRAWPGTPGIRAVYPLIRGRARLNHMTKSFYGNNDKAKGWQKGMAKWRSCAPFNFRAARAV